MHRTLLWMLRLTLLCVLALSAGCVRQRVVLVPPGDPVQIAEPVQVRVFVTVDGERIMSDNKVELPVGWWALPDPARESSDDGR